MLLWRFGEVKESPLLKNSPVWEPLHPSLWQSEQCACRRDSDLTSWSKLCQTPQAQNRRSDLHLRTLCSQITLHTVALSPNWAVLETLTSDRNELEKKEPFFSSQLQQSADLFKGLFKNIHMSITSPLCIHPCVFNPDITHSQPDKHFSAIIVCSPVIIY